MLRPLLVSVATVLALATPVVPAATAADDVPAARAGGITGTWKGKVVNQDGPAGYSGTIRLTRSGGKYRAKVRYSGGVSATTWIYEGRRGGWFRFREIPRSRTDNGVGGTEIKVGTDEVLILRESDVLAKVVGDRELAGAKS